MFESKTFAKTIREVSNTPLLGYTENEVRALERQVDGHFPESYKVFLKVMGRSPCAILGEFAITFDDKLHSFVKSLELTGTLRQILERDQLACDVQVSSDVFACGLQQFDDIVFIELSHKSDDPPVLEYQIADREFVNLEDSFSAFVVKTLRYYANPFEGMKRAIEDDDVF